MNKKVYHFLRESHDKGGTSKVVYKLSNLLNKYIPNVIVAFESDNKDLEFIPIKKNFLNDIKNLLLKQLLIVPYFNLKTYKLSKNLTKNKNSIVISHGFESLNGDIIHLHSISYVAFRQKLKNRDYKALFYPLHYYNILREFFIMKKFKQVITISNQDKEDVIKYFKIPKEKVNVVHNGVDIEQFKVLENKKELRRELGVKDTFTIIFVGHYYKNKGLMFLIKSLQYLKDKNINCLIIGQDNPTIYKEKAKELGVLDKIQFLGFRTDVNRLMSVSDIFVLPTYNEPFGLVGVEALASGIPILMTKTQGPKDYLKDGKNGFFIKRDEKDIAQKIEKLYSDRELLKKMSIQAREDSLEFSWDNVAKKYLKVIEKIKK